MTQSVTNVDPIVVAVSIVIVGLWFLSSYAVARYWRLNRGRSLTAGWIVSFFLSPMVGWVVGRCLQPDRAALRASRVGATKPEPATSLHDVFQQTYQEVDEKLHAHG